MKGIVYEIYSDSHPDIRYVGSTTTTLEKRWQYHKGVFKNTTKRRPIICKYFEEFGIDNFQIRVIKEYDIVDSNHLLAYEQLWINKLKSINLKKNLVLTKKIRQMQQKEYYENNREKKKLYYEENKESISEKKKLYYENNREKIREKRQRTYICPCQPDKELLLDKKTRHERSIKHQKYLQSLEEKKE